MRYLIGFLISIHLLFIVNTNINAAKGKDKDQVMVKVEGLGCPFCAYGLEKKFKEIKGIKDIKIEMETGEMTFTVPAKLALSQETIVAQVDKAGYTAVDVVIERANGEVITMGQAENNISTGEAVHVSLEVSGNCGMCKARIEQAAKSIDGVQSASWDAATQLLSLAYTGNQEVTKHVQEAVAKAGHDTGEFKAATEVYENLPPCCLYDRAE